MRRQTGFTLVEVLVAMAVLSVGLLGLASLQMMALRSNSSALFHTQATNLSYLIIDSMKANRQAALNGDYTTSLTSVASTACITSTSPAPLLGSIAQQDTQVWCNTLACTLPQGTGSILVNGSVVTITLQWEQATGQVTTLSSPVGCGGVSLGQISGQTLQQISMMSNL